ncbi:DUF5675 family protein [Limibacter armeniacum]|uniref:DUF5675 family protein n=1 Tax=Limibacter armeniacum TaxID=466084 RepID=UPI002FE5E864
MSNYKATLTRIKGNSKQTEGIFSLYNNRQKLFECRSLELPWLNNQQNISCIPTGTYHCTLRTTGKYKNRAFHVTEKNGQEVKGRSGILIHSGTYNSHTKGCVLLGLDLSSDLNADGQLDVTYSAAAIELLVKLAITYGMESFDLTVN